jgi:hypothetical protein
MTIDTCPYTGISSRTARGLVHVGFALADRRVFG